jgi:hypothetical protein
MSETKVHVTRSLENISKTYPDLFESEEINPRVIMADLHFWLDFYCGRKGKDREGDFDFTGHLCIRHRAKRHHFEGILEIVDILTKEYGPRFSEIIRQEAERHIYDDMGRILFADDYKQIGFWKNHG